MPARVIPSVPFVEGLYASMLRIRRVEECIADLVERGEVLCPCHLCIGQEAIPAGICAALRRDDYVWGGHRSHGHYLAKGGDLTGLLAEILGKPSGCSGGRGGSMHLFAPEVGILGTVPLVAATIPLAVGAALATRRLKTDRVSVSFFGDGATEEGHYHESVNLAALWKLPVVFVCENNLYASHLSLSERRAAEAIVDTARALGVPGDQVDGNDVLAVHTAAVQAVAHARAVGPVFLECRTFRWRGHVGPAEDLDVGVRRRADLAGWMANDPIARAGAWLQAAGMDAGRLAAIERDAREEVRAALARAKAAPDARPEDAGAHVFAARVE